MKRFLLFLMLTIFSANIVFAEEFDYVGVYQKLEIPNFKFVHDIDPGQYYDNKDATWSPYPLFRLNSPLYFKSLTIVPGYYLLTPTVNKDKDYLLFKQNGLVMYTLPVYKKEFVPEGFYEAHLPQPKLTLMQKMSKNTMSFIGKHFKKAKRKPSVQSYLEVNDLDNQFVSIVVYYGAYKYFTLFRTVKF